MVVLKRTGGVTAQDFQSVCSDHLQEKAALRCLQAVLSNCRLLCDTWWLESWTRFFFFERERERWWCKIKKRDMALVTSNPLDFYLWYCRQSVNLKSKTCCVSRAWYYKALKLILSAIQSWLLSKVWCHNTRPANSPWFCRKLPKNRSIFPSIDEQIWKSPWLWKLVSYYVECDSKHHPDCCTKSPWLQDANVANSAIQITMVILTTHLKMNLTALWNRAQRLYQETRSILLPSIHFDTTTALVWRFVIFLHFFFCCQIITGKPLLFCRIQETLEVRVRANLLNPFWVLAQLSLQLS